MDLGTFVEGPLLRVVFLIFLTGVSAGYLPTINASAAEPASIRAPRIAIELRHDTSPRGFFRILSKQEIRSVEMKACWRCGAPFVPEPLYTKVTKSFANDYLQLCPGCRATNVVDLIAAWRH